MSWWTTGYMGLQPKLCLEPTLKMSSCQAKLLASLPANCKRALQVPPLPLPGRWGRGKAGIKACLEATTDLQMLCFQGQLSSLDNLDRRKKVDSTKLHGSSKPSSLKCWNHTWRSFICRYECVCRCPYINTNLYCINTRGTSICFLNAHIPAHSNLKTLLLWDQFDSSTPHKLLVKP